jgi:hypothetical protein
MSVDELCAELDKSATALRLTLLPRGAVSLGGRVVDDLTEFPFKLF